MKKRLMFFAFFVRANALWSVAIALCCLVIALGSSQNFAADNLLDWPQFRGPAGDGLAFEATPPLEWSEEKNVSWKTKMPGRGWSSPVVSGNEIWLTTATADGLKMSVICVDFATGAIKHEQLIFENTDVQPDYHVTNSYASPTPVVEEDSVYVHYGSYGTARLNRATCEIIWQRRDLPCNHYRGAGSSPIVYQDLLIFHMDGFDYQYAVALDKRSGDTVWKKDRNIDYGTDNGDFYKAFSTPIVIEVNGQNQLISAASKSCLALDPATGEEIWRVRYDEHSTTVRPLFDGEHIYLSTGFGKAKMMRVRVDGKGDVTDSHVDWIQRKGIGSKPSPVLVEGKLFDITDDGILERLDTQTGEIVWQRRLGGKFSASLLATRDHIIAFDHDGKGYVFTAEDKPQLVSENQLAEGCNASPAAVGNSLIVRTTGHLYRLVDAER